MRNRLTVTLATAFVLCLLVGLVPAYADYSATPRTGTWVPNGRVNAIVVQGDRVYIGGTFTSVRNPVTRVSVARSRLAAFDAATGDLVTSFDPAADATVRALAVSQDGSTVYAAGDFTTVNGAAHRAIAAVDADGDLVPGWSSPATGPVRDLVLSGDALFAAGKFATATGGSRVGVGRLDVSSGARDASWKAWTGQGLPLSLAVSPDGSRLVVGGTFKVIGGVSHSFLAAVSVADGSLTPWRPPVLCDTCLVLDVTAAGTDVFAAVGGPGGRMGAWDADLDVLRWQRRADGDVQAVAHHEGVVYAGGHFSTNFANAPRNQLAAVTVADGTLLDFAPAFSGDPLPGIWALAAGPDYLRVGGGFRGIEGSSAMRYAELAYQ